jgi:hypothetical protein
MDELALNYTDIATCNDGSCIYEVDGILPPFYTDPLDVPETFDIFGNPIDPSAFLHTRKMLLKLVNTKINLSHR